MKVLKKSITVCCVLLIALTVCVFTGKQLYAQNTFKTYEQYRADWYKDTATLESYLNYFEMPYQTYVKNAPEEFKDDLEAWKIGSLGLEAGATYSTDQVTFYQMLLMDILYQEFNNTAYANELSGNLNMTDMAALNKLNSLDKTIQPTTPVTKENFDTLIGLLGQVDVLKDGMSYFSNISEAFGLGGKVQDLTQMIAKAQVMSNFSDETAEILRDMKNDASGNPGLAYALEEFAKISAGELTKEQIEQTLINDTAIQEGTKKGLGALWAFVTTSNPLGQGAYIGQQFGKFASNIYLGSDVICDSYYSMEMLGEFQDILKDKVNAYRDQYNRDATEENARKLNQAIALYYRTLSAGMDYTIRYVDAVKKGGVVNYLYTSFNVDDYDTLMQQLNSIKKCIDDEVEFFTSTMRNIYNDEYGQTYVNVFVPKEPVKMNQQQYEETCEKRDQGVFTVTNHNFTENYTLTADMETYGDVRLEDGTLDINGHKLTTRGNLIQPGGILKVNKGILDIQGDYRIQNETGGFYGDSDGALRMENSADHVIIGGDFINQSTRDTDVFSSEMHLSDGVMEIKGDFTQIDANSIYDNNFNASGNHQVIFNGDGNQVIKLEDGQFANISYPCGSLQLASPIQLNKEHKMTGDLEIYTEKGVSLSDETWDLNGHRLTIHGKEGEYVNSEGSIESSNGQLIIDQNMTWSGGILTGGDITVNNKLRIENSTIDLAGGKLTIGGDLVQPGGILKINTGTLTVAKDYRIQSQSLVDGSYGDSNGVLQMENSADHVIINGDFINQSTRDTDDYSSDMHLSDGVMEIKGDFTQIDANSIYDNNFNASGNHHVIFSGDGNQVITLEDGQFVNISYPCGSLHLASPIQLNKEHEMTGDLEIYTGRGVSLSDDTWKLNGYQLTIHGFDGLYENSVGDIDASTGKLIIDKDMTWTSGTLTGGDIEIGNNLRLNNGTIDLAGGKLMTAGDLIQPGGILKINTGILTVGKDYRIQSQSIASYGDSSGALQMENSADHVIINGDFINQSTRDTDDYSSDMHLSDGVMEIKGDFTQIDANSIYDNNFNASGNHHVILNGTDHQTVTFEGYDGSHFNILEITRPRSSYTFNPDPCWVTLIEPEVIHGDLNNDGKVDLLEARRIRQAAMHQTELSEEEFKSADINGDGKIDLLEARQIKQAAMKQGE